MLFSNFQFLVPVPLPIMETSILRMDLIEALGAKMKSIASSIWGFAKLSWQWFSQTFLVISVAFAPTFLSHE